MEFVYKPVDDADIPFCVGITNNPNARLQQHMADNPHVQELQKNGIKTRMQFIEILDTRKEARKREKFWILEYLSQGYLLTNIVHAPKARMAHNIVQLMIVQSMNEVPILPKKKAVGWLQFFEIDEAWTSFLDKLEPTLEAMERFYATFSSDRLPVLREKDQEHLDIWYSCEHFRLAHPNNDWHGVG